VKATPADCIHLTVQIVREIHREMLAAFGGADGLRDQGLLESAVAAPQATFGGESPFSDLVEVAAAYLFYLCRNHPFLDGNKRTAMTSAIVFLRLNGIWTPPDGPDWEALVLDVASSRIDREETTARLRKLLRRRSRRS
jgi:death-on-curing protein